MVVAQPALDYRGLGRQRPAASARRMVQPAAGAFFEFDKAPLAPVSERVLVPGVARRASFNHSAAVSVPPEQYIGCGEADGHEIQILAGPPDGGPSMPRQGMGRATG